MYHSNCVPLYIARDVSRSATSAPGPRNADATPQPCSTAAAPSPDPEQVCTAAARACFPPQNHLQISYPSSSGRSHTFQAGSVLLGLFRGRTWWNNRERNGIAAGQRYLRKSLVSLIDRLRSIACLLCLIGPGFAFTYKIKKSIANEFSGICSTQFLPIPFPLFPITAYLCLV